MKKSNYIYLYNKDFISLLNLIKYLLTNKILPNNIKDISYQPNLFEETLNLEITQDDKVIQEIISATSLNIFNTIYNVFLSNEKNKELLIFYFLIHSLKHKNKIFYMRNIKSVQEALRVSRYVGHETHKMKGFLRFRELKGKVLYAEIAPENNILFFVSKHFKNRLKNELWIIEDTKRNLISIYNRRDFTIVSSKDFVLLEKELSETEENIEELWNNFYKTIAIKERTNSRCRMSFMPKKYWKYITEMRDEIEKSN